MRPAYENGDARQDCDAAALAGQRQARLAQWQENGDGRQSLLTGRSAIESDMHRGQ
jgi:hypothetical protein